MQYVTLVDSYGGLNTFMAPDKVGPSGAVSSVGVDIASGTLKNRVDDTKVGIAGVWTGVDTYVPYYSQTIVPWGIGALGMTERYAVARFGGRLYRSHKGFGPFPQTVTGIQYTSNTNTPPTWDFFGLITPGTPTFAVADAGSGSALAAETYTYYCTFYNALGQESPPASASVTLSTSRDVAVTLPKGYGTCTTTNNSPDLTSVTNISKFRIGMRITGTNIPADSYVISINSGTNTIVISKNATGNGSSITIVDAQIAGTKVYRQGGPITTPLLVKTTAGLATTSFTDNFANNALGPEIQTLDTADIIDGLRDISISPSGVMLAAGPDNSVYYFSLVLEKIYDAQKFIKCTDSPLAIIYALDRFICPTIRGAFTVTIDDAILGLPVVQNIDDSEPCQVSYYVYPCDVGGEVWWNTNKGIVSTNGVTIQTVTKYIFDSERASYMRDAFGVEYFNGDYYLYADSPGTYGSLYKFSRNTGWSIVTSNLHRPSLNTEPRTIGFHIGEGLILLTGEATDALPCVRKLYASSSRAVNGVYATGDWTGDKYSSLKKFRKISILHNGNVTIDVYLDGAYLTTLTATASSLKRSSFWLPSGAKGRAISVAFSLTSASAEVEEIGVWVGEQREPMP